MNCCNWFATFWVKVSRGGKTAPILGRGALWYFFWLCVHGSKKKTAVKRSYSSQRVYGPIQRWSWKRSVIIYWSCRSKVPWTRGLNNRNPFSHSYRGQKSEIKVSGGAVPPEGSAGRMCFRPPALASHHLPFAWICIQIASSYKDPSYIRLGPTLIVSFYLNYLSSDLTSKYDHILKYWGLELQKIQILIWFLWHSFPF